MTLNWKLLLSDSRFSKNEVKAEKSKVDSHRSAFEADCDRIVYSAPFRRLAKKTQVHPFSENDHVHNRLTHSIEVASVGRSFGKRLGIFLKEQKALPEDRTIEDISTILQASCLVHDIGNPPFGHAGEFALREWVRVNEQEIFRPSSTSVAAGTKYDLLIFEGNAQGYRLACRSDNAKTGYMRLTFATLGAMIKYPWDSLDPRAEQIRKFNVFSSEKDHFHCMSDEMGLVRGGAVLRHPLSFLSEAADDICYRTLDLEDAVDMRIITESEIRPVFLKFLEDSAKDTDSLAILRGMVIQKLIDECWEIFKNNYTSIINGDFDKDLKSCVQGRLADGLTSIKEKYETIFAERKKVVVELAAYQVLGRIVDILVKATLQLSSKKSFDDVDFLNKRRLELAWGADYVTLHQREEYSWWLHQVMDYVSGLTDNYAHKLSREITGN